MSVVVISEVDTCVNGFLSHTCIVEKTFSCYDGTVVHSHNLPLEDGGDGQADNLVESHLGLVEHLRNDGHRAVGRLANTECQRTAGASHCADYKPVAGSACILVDGPCKVCALILRRIVAESRSIGRERKVVVDGLRAVDVGDRIVLCSQEFGNPVCSGSCVVAAYGNEKLDVVVLEEVKVEILFEILVSRLETAHFEVGTAPVPETVCDEEIEIFGACILAEQTGVAAVKADYPVTF